MLIWVGSRIEPIFLTETDQKEDVVEASASEDTVVDPAPVDTEAPSAEEPKVEPVPETLPTEDSVEEAVVEPVAAVPTSEAPVAEPAASDAPATEKPAEAAAEPVPTPAAADAPKSTIGLPMTEATDAWMDDDDLGAGGFSDSDEEAAAPVAGEEPVAAEPVAAEPAAEAAEAPSTEDSVEEAAASEIPLAEESVEETAAEPVDAPAAETPSEEAKDSVEIIETEADIEKTTEGSLFAKMISLFAIQTIPFSYYERHNFKIFKIKTFYTILNWLSVDLTNLLN